MVGNPGFGINPRRNRPAPLLILGQADKQRLDEFSPTLDGQEVFQCRNGRFEPVFDG